MLTVGTPRVVVIWSVAFCKERADFEPGEILGAGRVLVHVMVMANVPLRQAAADIRFKRPEKMNHSMNGMNKEVGSCLFSDSNNYRSIVPYLDPPELLDPVIAGVGAPPSPYWHDLFDAYEVGVSRGTYRAIDPLERGGVIRGAIQRLESLNETPTYVDTEIKRVARQGAYDNIHMAPTMTMKNGKSKQAPPDSDVIFMAPFCEHDCFHTHWRWGAANTPRTSHGFSDKPCARGTMLNSPYAEAGAPMAPSNQTVDVEMVSAVEWIYRARADGRSAAEPGEPIPAGTFSFFNHHGSGYSLALVGEKTAYLVDLTLYAFAFKREEPSFRADRNDAALRYWRLRFGGQHPNNVMERLKFLDKSRILGRTSG